MLKQRVITALLLLPLVVWGILCTPNEIFSAVLALVFLLCANEWARLAGLKSLFERFFYLASIGGLMAGLWLRAADPVLDLAVLAIAGIWVGMSAGLFSWRTKPLQIVLNQPVVLLFGLMLLPFAWYALAMLHNTDGIGPQLTLAMMVLIWLADSAAYFGGRRFGRTRLAPVLSPNKTVEGLVSALLAAVAWVFAVKQLIAVDIAVLPLLLIAIVTTLVSVAGDLFESMVKRRADQKDSGKLLPGHGGIWDRIDSLISAAPVFLAMMALFGGIE